MQQVILYPAVSFQMIAVILPQQLLDVYDTWSCIDEYFEKWWIL